MQPGTERNANNINTVVSSTMSSVIWDVVEGQTAVECELLTTQHKSKFCSLTTCNHLTADSPLLSLARFQAMPTHKTSCNPSKSFSLQSDCSLELASVQPPHGANLWKTLRPQKNVTMVNETERETGRGRKQTNTLHSPWALSRQTSQMLIGPKWLWLFAARGIISCTVTNS